MKQYILSPYVIPHSFEEAKVKLYNDYNKRFFLISKDEMKMLLDCRLPISYLELCEKYTKSRVEKFIRWFLLLESDNVWNYHRFQHIEIETSTVCNWKCEYCPNSIHQRLPRYMDFSLFQIIMQRAKEYKYIKYVTLHAYNEPTLDPRFFELVNEVQKQGFRLVLYTNGSYLDEAKIKHLIQLGNLKEIIFNIPSFDKKIMQNMTGSTDYDNVMNAIDLSIKNNIAVTFSIQGRDKQREKASIEISKNYPQCKIVSHDSFDRAGSLTNKYFQNYAINETFLAGCVTMNEAVNVTVDGDITLCCNDYYRKNLFGNLRNNSLSSLLTSNLYTKYKRIIWGGEKAPTDFICRNCIMMEMAFERNRRIEEVKKIIYESHASNETD